MSLKLSGLALSMCRLVENRRMIDGGIRTTRADSPKRLCAKRTSFTQGGSPSTGNFFKRRLTLTEAEGWMKPRGGQRGS